MEGVVSSQYQTPLVYQRSKTPAASGYKRSYRGCAPFKVVYARIRCVHNIPQYIKKTEREVRKLQQYDKQLKNVKT